MSHATSENVGTRLLFENERVRVWEMVLEPGARSELHHHRRDYILCIVSGTSIDADTPAGQSQRFPVHAGQVFWVPRGGTEWAVNRSTTRFHEMIVELKDTPQQTP